MAWGAFSALGKSSLAVMVGKQDSAKYVEVLQSYLMPFADAHIGTRWIFQQDNAAIHRSRLTMEWLNEKQVRVMGWPARSPDLNPIENLWGILAMEVYENGRQFNSVSQLRDCVMQCWEDIGRGTLNKLINSMHKRCEETLRKRGGITKYYCRLKILQLMKNLNFY